MFVDHIPSIQPAPEKPAAPASAPVPSSKVPWWRNKIVMLLAGVLLVLVLGALAWWYFGMREQAIIPVPAQNTNQPSGLPETLEPNENNPVGQNSNESDLKGETVSFGAFYKPMNEPLDIKIKPVTLPLNVKSDVSNYYDISRRINLDAAVGRLNQNGFALIDSPYPEQNADFFATYAKLSANGIPALITEDFLLYYYQNSLKRIYKELEASYFYDSIWKVNKQLFDSANGRYQERRQKLGVSNDALLEAERLEASYFAMALSLLAPTPDQVSITEDLNDSSKFKPSEAKRYEFNIPSYLSDDIAKEMNLVKAAGKPAKSPIFLYMRDYGAFKVPVDYAVSAKLKNFYMATAWQSSLFPVNYKSANCPECLLDKDDWTINQIAAYLIAQDLQSSQPLKNEWAKIYKVMGYFTGLRSELTYLNYHQARADLFKDKTVEEIFGAKAFENLSLLSRKLNELNFLAAEGGLDRKKAEDRANIGLRLLQNPFSPDQYLYGRLTFSAVGTHNQPKRAANKPPYLTACANNDQSLFRCKGIGFDIIAAASPIVASSGFLKDNTNYQHYADARSALARELSALSAYSWHATNFWTTLDITRSLLAEKINILPYSLNAAWADRQLQAGLSALAFINMSADQWESARTVTNRFGGSGSSASFDYIEPQQALIDELNANALMLQKTLSSLGVVKADDTSFKQLTETLASIRGIARKELKGESLTPEDYLALSEFMGQYKVTKAGTKTALSSFADPDGTKVRNVKKNITPLKLLLLIYEKDGKKILAAGPVYGYKEE